AVSEQLTNRLQSNAAEKDDDDDDEESSDESNADLKSLFAVGQYLRVYVVSTLDESAVTGKARRKIELSLRPAETNEGLDKDDIVANGTVMASVVSVEDHGCVMDIGIPGL